MGYVASGRGVLGMTPTWQTHRPATPLANESRLDKIKRRFRSRTPLWMFFRHDSRAVRLEIGRLLAWNFPVPMRHGLLRNRIVPGERGVLGSGYDAAVV